MLRNPFRIRGLAELPQQFAAFPETVIGNAKANALTWRAASNLKPSLPKAFDPRLRISYANPHVHELLLWADRHEVSWLFSQRKTPKPLKICHPELFIW